MEFNNSVELQPYRDFMISLAQESGDFILPYFGKPNLKIDMKSDDTPVTIADRGAEELLRDRIHGRYPSHGIIGEEYGSENADAEFVWVLEGELVLVQDAGETVLRTGDAAGFRASDPDGHHLVNRSDALARYIVVGTRAADDVCHYAEVDLVFSTATGRFTRRDGTPPAQAGEEKENR